MKKKISSVAPLLFLTFTSLFAADFKNLDMTLLPQGSFIIGQDVQNYTAKRTVDAFYINKYETTYELWYNVKKTAEENGYVFNNPGQQGSQGRRGAEPVATKAAQPVVMITWYDIIVWCNALSELSGFEPCYTYKKQVIKDSTNTALCDLAECNFASGGYRLPTEAEWEYAARRTKTGFQPGNRVSGDTAQNTTNDNSLSYAWTSDNTYETRAAGTAGAPFEEGTEVQPGSGMKNAMGIFDMSGNVLEYCWDWFADYTDQPPKKRATGPAYGSARTARGGSFSEYTMFIFAADRYSFDPNERYDYIGFRLAQTKK